MFTEVTVSSDVYWADPHVASLFPQSWIGDPIFLIASEDIEGAAEAVNEAVERFRLLDDEGRELSEAQAASGLWRVPDYVSALHVTDEGIVVYIDLRGEFSKVRGERMIEILVAELWCRQVNAHITRPSDELDWAHAPCWFPAES